MEFNLLDSNAINELDIDLLTQGLLVFILVIYSGFALLVKKQVRILNESIHTTKAAKLNKIAKIHLIASVVLLMVSILLIVFWLWRSLYTRK